jgi:cyclopropane-fatty-acyl-phospholipid synthase
LTRPFAQPLRRLRRPDAGRDRADIAAHYDLGNDFFALFLDETMTYSSGIFATPDTTMAEASRAKLDRVCRQLDLRPGQRVVEIGTGWGSFALHAAANYGVEVVTTTLSAEQHAVATDRVAAAGLADRVEVRLDHYRDLTGTYDALVAIEMIEAVDWRELDDFLGCCGSLVGPDGAVAFQAIVAPPDRHERALASRDFIKTHVFPGGNLPSVASILDAAGRRTDLVPTDLVDFGPDYAETLRRWRTELHARRDEASQLGLTDEFLRLWDFYLSYCEAGFDERLVSVVQMVLARPGSART